MSNKQNIAIVGLGKQGIVYLESLLKLRDENKINILAICEKDKNFLRSLSQEKNIEGFCSYTEMIAKYGSDINLLIATLPNNVYYEIIFDSINQKFSILKEKPYATSVKEATVYEYIHQKSNLKIYTAQQRFFTKGFICAKKWIEEDILGKLLFFNYSYSLNDKTESWYWDCKAGGGCWLNIGWHMIFTIIWFFGKPDVINVDKIKTQKRSWKHETDDTSMFSCSYNNGLVGKGFVSVTDTSKEKMIKIVGSNGYIVIKKNKAILYNNRDEMINETENECDSEIYKKQIMSFINNEGRNIELENYNMQTMEIINLH